MNDTSFPDALFPAILYGGDYNPDQWPETVWDDDVRLMGKAHVNTATLPVFGWASVQPSENEWTWSWLDRIIDKLHAGGVSLCLATATASVPAWLDRQYPDVLRVGVDGRKLPHGGRHSFCPHSPNFRRLSVQLAGRMAERYGAHPALRLWHVGNEYGGNNGGSGRCYCEKCAAAFRVWLAGRYGTLDELNARWYTKFWGHTFSDWTEIEPPVTQGEQSIQALLIDYDRFQSDSLLECYKAERDVLRAATPAVPITTNLMGTFKPLDYHRWAKEMDVVSWDAYPGPDAAAAGTAFQHSLMRGLKEGRPWLLMEQTPSQVNWQPRNPLKRPGILRLWSWQAVAHGADAIMYFQWRRGRGGGEKFHGSVVEHAGREDARVFQEVAALGSELGGLGARTLGGRVRAQAAVLFDWDNWWATGYSSGPTVDLQYVGQSVAYFTALHDAGIVADVASPDAELSQYKVIVAPVLYMVKPGVAERLKAFVAAGGTLVATYFSGIADETDLVFTNGYPGPLKDLLGVWVEETDVLSPAQSNGVRFTGKLLDGTTVPCGMLCDRIHCEGAQIAATYTDNWYAGEPAVTVHAHGSGRAYYVGTFLQAAGLSAFLNAVCADAGVTLPLGALPPPDVEVVERVSPSGETLLYLLNHAGEERSGTLPPGASYRDLLTGDECAGTFQLPPLGVRVLARL